MNKNIIIVSDLDGTLTTQESSWQFVLENLNLWDNKGKKNLELFLTNQIVYDDFIKLDVGLMKGTTLDNYNSIFNIIPFRDGLLELFEYFKQLNSTNIIVSSGLKTLAERISRIIPVHHLYANEIHNDGKYLTGSYTKNIGWHDKEKIMKELRKCYQNSYIIAFGDTKADLALFHYADLRFSCFSNSTDLIAESDFDITDLKKTIPIIKSLLGT